MKTERMLPTIYRRSSDIRTICRYFDLELGLLEYYTNHILDCYSPEHCPEDLLKELAEHIGFEYNQLKSSTYNRVVLKHFIKHLIRYRGSQTGIANAAAVDVRYRQTQPMNYHEAIPVERAWIDTDTMNGIIYLFIISDTFLPAAPDERTDENMAAWKADCMRRLLDLSYLQEYVRPAGMYTLPLVAKKVNAQTDLTVKAIRVPDVELNENNGIIGTPNSSVNHEYDRMHFARLEEGDSDISAEPWIRTLYHSQVAGNLQHKYFNRPVYHITGKFLYYDHKELTKVYSEITGKVGMKVGDSLYNPNIPEKNYGNDPANEPMTLEEENLGHLTTEPFEYDEHGGWGDTPRYIQDDDMTENRKVPDPQGDYPPYLYTEDGDDVRTDMMINLFDDDIKPENEFIRDGDVVIEVDSPEGKLIP